MGASIGVCYAWFIPGFGDFAQLDVIHWYERNPYSMVFALPLVPKARLVAAAIAGVYRLLRRLFGADVLFPSICRCSLLKCEW